MQSGKKNIIVEQKRQNGIIYENLMKSFSFSSTFRAAAKKILKILFGFILCLILILDQTHTLVLMPRCVAGSQVACLPSAVVSPLHVYDVISLLTAFLIDSRRSPAINTDNENRLSRDALADLHDDLETLERFRLTPSNVEFILSRSRALVEPKLRC